MSKPFALYHWSLVARRKGILKYGLCPGKNQGVAIGIHRMCAFKVTFSGVGIVCKV